MKIKTLLLATLLPCFTLTGLAQTNHSNKIAAIVNNNVISTHQLDKQVNLTKALQAAQSRHTNFPANFDQMVLQNMIQTRLSANFATQHGIQVPLKNVEQQLAQNIAIAKKQGYDLEEVFTDAGFDHDDIIQLLTEKDLASAKPQEIKRSTKLSPEVQSHYTVFTYNDYANLTATQAKEIKTDLENGTSVKQKSTTKTSAYSNLPPLYQHYFISKKIKDVLGPIDLDTLGSAWHVLQITKEQPTPDYQKALLKKVNQAIANWLQQLKANAYIDIKKS
jgi:hypothetical protein